jgi:hypothetical protein
MEPQTLICRPNPPTNAAPRSRYTQPSTSSYIHDVQTMKTAAAAPEATQEAPLSPAFMAAFQACAMTGKLSAQGGLAADAPCSFPQGGKISTAGRVGFGGAPGGLHARI